MLNITYHVIHSFILDCLTILHDYIQLGYCTFSVYIVQNMTVQGQFALHRLWSSTFNSAKLWRDLQRTVSQQCYDFVSCLLSHLSVSSRSLVVVDNYIIVALSYL